MARKMRQPSGEPTVPATARPAYDAVVGLTNAFCREYLNEEYEALCRQLVGALTLYRTGSSISCDRPMNPIVLFRNHPLK